MSTVTLEISEKEWSKQVLDLALMYGFSLVYHTYRSTHSAAGFPDLVLASPLRKRVLFVETKAERGKLSEPQRYWLAGLRQAGAEAYCWRPSDLDEIPAILRERPVAA